MPMRNLLIGGNAVATAAVYQDTHHAKLTAPGAEVVLAEKDALAQWATDVVNLSEQMFSNPVWCDPDTGGK